MAPMSKMRKIRLIAILVVITVLLLVIWQNSAPTRLSLLFFSAELPLMIWLALFLISGILIGLALARSYRRQV